jgi:hypothetical protein
MTYNPGFTGGQCITQYRVNSYTDVYYWIAPNFSLPPPYVSCNHGANGVKGGPPDGASNSIIVDGPIALITINTANNSAYDACGSSQVSATITHGDNQTTSMGLGLPSGPGVYNPMGRNTRFSVQRVDGNPDNCGNPTPNQHPANPDNQKPCCGCAKPLF